jgi:hypothetical protein
MGWWADRRGAFLSQAAPFELSAEQNAINFVGAMKLKVAFKNPRRHLKIIRQ